MKRIILHWTGGTGLANTSDRAHYHILIEQDGKVIAGTRNPESNLDTSDGDYAAHTRALNTGSIGVALCAMSGAREHPFSAGYHAITDAQVDALAVAVADLCATYGIPVTPRTVLTHAEVPVTLGVAQQGKWDVTFLPGMHAPDDPLVVGDTIRSMIQRELIKVSPPVAQGPVTLIKRILQWLQSLMR